MLAAALVSAPRVEAATRTWDGGGADNNWSTAANWSADTLPVAGDTVTFNGTSTKPATIDVAVTVAVFQMNAGYTGTITQAAGQPVSFTTSYTQSAGTFIGGASTITVTGGTTVNSGGTFNGGSATINLNGALTVNAGGAFTSTSGTLTVTGAVTFAAGVFTHNSGTVAFSTSSVTLNLGGAATFNNVQFVSGTKTLTAANTMTVLGTLTLAGGIVNTGTIAAQGNINSQAGFAGGTTTLLINGSSPQTWSGSAGGATDLLPVNINNPASTLTLTAGLRTTHSWTFTASGGLTAAASSIIFAGGTITGTHSLGAVEIAGAETIAAGTTLSVPGNLTLTSGTLTTGTLAAQGNISIATAFTGGTTTLLINGSSPQTWSGSANGAADTLLVVNINNPASTLTLTAGLRTTHSWTFTASGGLTAAASSIIFAGGTITGTHSLGAVEIAGAETIAAGTTLSVPGNLTLTSGTLTTGTLAAQGNISIATAFTGGTTTLLINGSSPQTWSGSANGAADTLLVVNINNPASTLTLTAGLRTTHSWTFTASGGLTAAASSIIFAGGTITGTHSLGAVEIAGAETIAAGTTLSVPGNLTLTSGTLTTGTLAAQGNISIATAFTGGTTTLLINGSSPQTWSGSANGAADTLLVVNINNPASTLTLTAGLRTTHSWTFTASGGLTAAASSIIFAGGTITGTHSLGAVEIAGAETIAAGTTLSVPGNLTLTSGTLNQAAATGTLAAQGDISAAVGFTGGTATLLINGSGPQAWTGAANTTTSDLPVVNLNNPGGTLTMTGAFRTSRNWTWTAGGLAASASSVIFASGIITGSHTLGNVDIRGTVTIAAATTLSVAGTTELTSGALNQVGATGILAAQRDVNTRIGFTVGGTATLVLAGAGNQTLTGFHTTAAGAMPNVDINKSSGTVTIAGTIRTGRNWTYTSGGLITSGSTLIFTGSSGTIITGSHTLGNVDLRGGTTTIAAGTTLTVGGTLELTSGGLNQVGATGILAAAGDINARVGFTLGGTATLLIDGPGAQTLTGFHTTAAGSMPNVDINKASGTLAIAGTLRTARNWTYTSGALNASGSTLIFNGTQTITGSHALDAVDIRGGTISIAAGTTLTVPGTLELTTGGLNQVGTTGMLAAEGDINARVGFTLGGTATLLIDGAGNQTLTGFHSANAGSMPNVDIDKASGTLSLVGTIRTGRNWTYTGGAMAVAGSTVVFNGTLTITGTHDLNNVEMHTGDVTVAAGDTLKVDGLLTLTDGNLFAGNVDALGDMVLLAGFDGEGGTFRIAGTADQTFTGFADTINTDMANLVIDKPSGTLHLVGTIRMLTSSWTWLQGSVDPGTSTVYFDTTVAISGTQSLFNVYLTGGAHTIAGGDTLTALGTLTLDNGTIDGGTIAGAGPIIQLSTFDGGSGVLAITGGSSHTFTGSATTAAGNLPAVQINTSGGTLTLAGTTRTANDWTDISGTVDPGSSTVVLAGNLSVDASGMSFNDILVNAGTVSLVANLMAAGDLTVAAGTLAIGAVTASVAGDVTINAGLTVTTGTLDMDGLSGQALGGSAAIGLYNLGVNDPTGVTQTTTVSVAGTLDLSGPYVFNGHGLSIAHAITGARDNLAGDGTSTLIVNGAGAGIVIPSSLGGLLNLAITNPNGAALAGPLTVVGTFTLGGGNLDAGSDTLSIGAAGGVSRTSGHVVGRLEKWVPAGSGVSVVYEIGDSLAYAPLSLVFGTVGGTGQMTAFTSPGEHPSIAASPVDPAQDVNRWWSLANAGVGFDTLAVTFTWTAADVDPGADPNRFVVGKWDGSWALPTSGANTATTITALGLTSLSEFAVGQGEADLLVSKDGPVSAIAGDPAGFDYTITVHNAGAADNVSGFTVSDALAAGLTFHMLGSDSRCLAVGQQVTCTNATGLTTGADDAFVIHVTLAPTVDSGTALANTAVVTSTGTGDPNGANNTSAAIVTTVAEDVQLSVIKAFAQSAVTAGGAGGTFTITVRNSGTSDADNLVVMDNVDSRLIVDAVTGGVFDCSFGAGQSIDCRLAHLAAGASQSVTVSFHVAASVGSATISNEADATSDEDHGTGFDNVDIIATAATATPTPSSTGSVADTSTAAMTHDVPPALPLLAFAGWIALMAALAAEGAAAGTLAGRSPSRCAASRPRGRRFPHAGPRPGHPPGRPGRP